MRIFYARTRIFLRFYVNTDVRWKPLKPAYLDICLHTTSEDMLLIIKYAAYISFEKLRKYE